MEKVMQRLMFLLVLLAFSGGQVFATTITADDILGAATTTTVNPHGSDSELINLGSSSLTVGLVTFTGTNDGVLTDLAWAQKADLSQNAGIGIDAFADGSKEKNEYRAINDDEKLGIAFSSAQTVNTIRIGRHGATDGDVAISGFTSDPDATYVNEKYDGTPGVGSGLYDAVTGILTFDATQFGYIEVTFGSATNISLLQLYQVGRQNDGFTFESLTFGELSAAYGGYVEQAINATGVDVTLNWNASADPDSATSGYAVYPDITDQSVFMTSGLVGDPNFYFIGQTGDPGTSDPASQIAVADLPFDTEYSWIVVEELPGYEQVFAAGNTIDDVDPNNLIGPAWSFTTLMSDPAITKQPKSVTMPPGVTETILTVEALATDTYKWYRVDTPDALVYTDSTPGTAIDISSYTVTAEGYYYCVVSSNSSAVTMQSDIVRVMVAREVAHWNFEENLVDTISGYPGLYTDPTDPNATPAPVYTAVDDAGNLPGSGQAMIFDGDNDGGQNVQIQGDPNEFIFYGLGYTVSAWVKTTDVGSGAAVCKPDDFKLSSAGAKATHSVRSKTVTSADDVAINNGQWRLMTGTYDADTRMVKLYVDGVLVEEEEKGGAVNNYGTAPLILGASTIEGGTPFTGYLDEVRIWNYPRTAEDIVVDYYNVTGVAPCYQPNFPGSVFDVAGAVDGSGDPIGDCKVDIQDFVEFAKNWLVDGFYHP